MTFIGYLQPLHTGCSVALSSALTALPTNGGTGSHTCGVGAGVRGEYTAMGKGLCGRLSELRIACSNAERHQERFGQCRDCFF